MWISFIILIILVLNQGDFDSKASPHIKKEMLRIYTKEKSWRERIWRSGIIKSSPMPLRKCPEYVGTEEVILYLNCIWCLHTFNFLFLKLHINITVILRWQLSSAGLSRILHALYANNICIFLQLFAIVGHLHLSVWRYVVFINQQI